NIPSQYAWLNKLIDQQLIPLVTVGPHLGGRRFWFRCACCTTRGPPSSFSKFSNVVSAHCWRIVIPRAGRSCLAALRVNSWLEFLRRPSRGRLLRPESRNPGLQVFPACNRTGTGA